MKDLRLVGVHEDGQHLLLTDGDAGRFRLPLDDTLRAAARRDRARLGQLQIELDGGMRPREVQALIRTGLSAEEVADRAGWTVDKVRRYEGPVLAEREYVAGLARAMPIRHHGRTDTPTLQAMVHQRLTGRGVDPRTATWDAARDPEGQWRAVVVFAAGGRERTASWNVDLPSRILTPRDDEARWLTEEADTLDGPIPHQPRPTPPSTVYDVETDGGVGAPRATRRASHEPIDLVAAMRQTSSRRRARRSSHQPTLTPVDDALRHDALPLEPAHHGPDLTPPPAARGVHPLDREPEPEQREDPPHLEAPPADLEPAALDDEPADEVVDETVEEVVDQTATGEDADGPNDQAPGDPESATSSTPQRRGRPRVPAWEDIMFGSR